MKNNLWVLGGGGLETPGMISFVNAMLVQSAAEEGFVRLFPYLPHEHGEVSFARLSAEGGFLLSATMAANGSVVGEVVVETSSSSLSTISMLSWGQCCKGGPGGQRMPPRVRAVPSGASASVRCGGQPQSVFQHASGLGPADAHPPGVFTIGVKANMAYHVWCSPLASARPDARAASAIVG
eukprot:SAG22_NODE_944_length_6390_cov_3.189795_7_plen_181_part_00